MRVWLAAACARSMSRSNIESSLFNNPQQLLVKRYILVDLLLERKLFDHLLASCCSDRPIVPLPNSPLDALGKLAGIERPRQKTVHLVVDQLGHSADIECDNRRATRERLDYCIGKIFHARGSNEYVGGVVKDRHQPPVTYLSKMFDFYNPVKAQCLER